MLINLDLIQEKIGSCWKMLREAKIVFYIIPLDSGDSVGFEGAEID